MKIVQKMAAVVLTAAMGFTPPVYAYSVDSHVVRGLEKNGGSIDVFLKNVEFYKKHKIRVVLRGYCASACGLYSILVAHKLVCAEPKTVLIFHRPEESSKAGLRLDANGAVISRRSSRPSSPDKVNRFWLLHPRHVRQAIMIASKGQGLPMPGKELKIPAAGIPELGIPPLIPAC